MASTGDSSPTSSRDEERKKLRNRLSQRAFRRRQAECIRDLRSRVDGAQKADSDRINQLQHENTLLRAELVKLQGKLSLLMSSVQGLSDSITHTLDTSSGPEEEAPSESPSSDQSQICCNMDLDWSSLQVPYFDVAEPAQNLALDSAGFPSTAVSDPLFADILWATDLESRNITQNYWVAEKNKFRSQSQSNGKFRPSKTGLARSPAGIVCRGYNDTWHDISWYNRDSGSLLYYFCKGSAEFSKPRDFGGRFIGDPALVFFANNPQRLDFFSVGKDHQVYHLSRIGDDYSKLEALSGNMTSTPTVVSPFKGVMDVVALGRDGRIKHLHCNGSVWADEWEDIGVSASAAPQVVIFNGRVVLFALGKNEVRYASWESGGESSWADLVKMKSLPGVTPSLDFFQEKL